jgi:predicted metal-dependent phosphoesterase TrpH
MTRVDLHLHSTASDGQYSPTRVVQLALERQVGVISLTDHDTLSGVQEALDAARASGGVTVIPGVEISTDVPGKYEIHMLGYYVDIDHAPLQEQLSVMSESRLNRARKIWERLGQMGCVVSWERVLGLAGDGVVGRPHIAQVLVEAGYAASVQEAFQRYIGRNARAYVPRPKLLPQEAIELILEAGGVPVLAHPSYVVEHIPSLVRAGLAGLEAYYGSYSETEQQFLARLARKHSLIATGGSDYHGPLVLDSADIGGVDVPWSAVEELESAHRRIRKRGPQALSTGCLETELAQDVEARKTPR